MNKYSKLEIQKLRDADIRMFIRGASESKGAQDIDCPFCDAKKKFRVMHKGAYNYAKCWVCQQGFSGPLEAYAHMEGLDIKRDYLKVVEGVARMAGIELTPEEDTRKAQAKERKDSFRKTFALRQLEASGLTPDDVTANVIVNNVETTLCAFRPGSIGEGWKPDLKGDDMLIFYYDLWGRPVQYTPKGSKALRDYVRVRYANPDIHTDDNGEPVKYKSPAGSASQVYIPEAVRRMFRTKQTIDTLFLQEGEKKAEKACKHGMLSLGLQGIGNIGNKESGLIQAIQDVVKRCEVKNIVLVMDSDWNDLSRNIRVGDRADNRPNIFASAVIKFKQYIRTFYNLELNVDAWWGHVNENEQGDKGVDDLLVGSLKGKESELMEDITATMNSHSGKGKWLDIHKITELSDTKIRDFWTLNDWPAFYELHKDRLEQVTSFKLGNMRYKSEGGKLMPIGKYSSDIDIYSIEEDSKGKEKVQINYTETFKFLNESGFFRCVSDTDDADGFEYIRIDDGIIDRSAPYKVRDFIMDYIMSYCKSTLVHEYFNSKIDVLLNDKKIERLKLVVDNFNNFEPDVQRSYYNNGGVEITAKSITSGHPINNVWRSRIVPRNFKRIPIIDWIEHVGDYYAIQFTAEGMKSDFVRYIINTSNNCYSHDNPRTVTQDERYDWDQHLVNKITAIGYLLTDWKHPTDRKAVVIQDHLISEVGQSWGGAGKSVLGTAIGKVTVQKSFDGKKFEPKADFALDGVTRATRNIFIDDIRPNFNFQAIFNWVTGDLDVNPKGKTPYVIKAINSPKILLTTNHAIKDADQGSVARRIAYVEFSGWYNKDHTPIEDFGHTLFDEWDELQWQLFDNFMAECVMYYMRSLTEAWNKKGEGVVPPPMRNIELRTLRQSMSEVLLQWAEEYYDPSGDHLNARESRKDLWENFYAYAGGLQGHGVTRTNFKRKIIEFCKYKGYDFNINKPMSTGPGRQVFYSDWKKDNPDKTFEGDDDKSNSCQYFTVYSQNKGAAINDKSPEGSLQKDLPF